MSWELHRGDARKMDMIPDGSVDLIVTSPPYFGQRSYQDGGEHYDGQIGSEPTPREFLDALWAVTAECWRVLKPSGSMFVNLGDKRSGSSAPGTTSGLNGAPQGDRTGMTEGARRPRRGQNHDNEPRAERGYPVEAFGRPKSKQLLPHRYAIGCEDGLADPDGIGWVMREELVWAKSNGMPESVRDRCRDSHEYWFHLTRRGDYFSAVDEIREPHIGRQSAAANSFARNTAEADVPGARSRQHREDRPDVDSSHPLGKLPGSVWTVSTEPLSVPAELEVEHFAAFPSEWPRRLILGWCPAGICTACDQGRAPLVERPGKTGRDNNTDPRRIRSTMGGQTAWDERMASPDRIIGYSCACDTPVAPTRPAVVLDPFSGTGTTVMVAHALGRHGIGVDLSADYLRLAEWRIEHDPRGSRVRAKTNGERQGVLL